jgi:thiamine-phosphate pyrophosphorylase
MIDGGARIIQYREKEKSLREKYADCLAIRQMTEERGVTFIVNDDVALALAVRADGVHIGQDDMPVEAVRALVGNEMLIGLSTHTPEQARDAVLRGADYIGVGPVYATQTKRDAGAPVGLSYLDYAAAGIPVPHVAIGGIKRGNLDEVLRHGARCVAMISEIVSAPDIAARVQEILSQIEALKQGDAGR